MVVRYTSFPRDPHSLSFPTSTIILRGRMSVQGLRAWRSRMARGLQDPDIAKLHSGSGLSLTCGFCIEIFAEFRDFPCSAQRFDRSTISTRKIRTLGIEKDEQCQRDARSASSISMDERVIQRNGRAGATREGICCARLVHQFHRGVCVYVCMYVCLCLCVGNMPRLRSAHVCTLRIRIGVSWAAS
jgi:hypothetical protein